MSQTAVVEVAVAILHRADGCVLLGKRPAGGLYAGYWEFPGGKIETGEQPHQALCREISEELNVRALHPQPWLVREHVYEHARVRLHFFRVRRWQGRLQPRIHSELHWLAPDRAVPAPMLDANGPILQALRLPPLIGITNTARYGLDDQLQRIDQALAGGLRRIHVREPTLDADTLEDFSRAVVDRAREHDAAVVLHARPKAESLAESFAEACERVERVGAHGLHLPAALLNALVTLPDKAAAPKAKVAGFSASCHNRAELLHAARLQVDYAFLSPIAHTPSHPHTAALGWGGFAALSARLPFVLYALGGLRAADLATAHSAGAHGIAAIRAVWQRSAQ